MEETAPEHAVGHRMARQRRLTGLTQQQLAAHTNYSPSLISQVERGVVPASPAFTAAVARELGIDVSALHGQPYGAPIVAPTADHAGVPALRTALDCADDPVLVGPPMTAAALRTRLDQCEADRGRSRYAQVAAALPELLQHAYVIAAEARLGVEEENACALLDDTYDMAWTVAYRFGYLDLATLASERRSQAATRSGDPLRVATAAFRRTGPRLDRGDYAGVQRVLDGAYRTIVDEHSPAADAVRAQLHLREAIAHARDGEADRADEHISVARELVATGVPAHPYYPIGATEGNVDRHWVSVPVELADGTTAVDRAARVRIPENGLERARAGHHWIHVARAWTLHGNSTEALDALNRARKLTPQQVRYHPQAHETVQLLVETDRRATDSLAGFARWIGVQL